MTGRLFVKLIRRCLQHPLAPLCTLFGLLLLVPMGARLALGWSNPLQAALASAASFVVGAALPLAVTVIAPTHSVVPWIAGMSLVFLGGLGGLAARAGGAKVLPGAWRVTLGGALAMGLTAAVGSAFGTVV